ncbi:MAG: hypothetical protein AB2540_13800 [Candidatus Thiodiazotropha endolucinida]
MNSIDDIEKAYGRALPNSYKSYINDVPDYAERYFKDDDEDDDFPGRPWFLLGVHRLSENLDMKGVGVEPMFSALRLYTKVFQEFSAADKVYSPQGNIPVQRVAEGFVFGEENGDYVYMDPSDSFSV